MKGTPGRAPQAPPGSRKEIKIDFGHGANPATVGSDYSENPALGKLDNGNIIVVWEDGDVGARR